MPSPPGEQRAAGAVAAALVPLSPILLLVATGHFFNDIYMGFLTPLYPIIMEKFRLSLSLVGAISMVAALASALSQPFFGMLYDRFGMTASLYLAPLLTGVLVSCVAVAPGYPFSFSSFSSDAWAPPPFIPREPRSPPR
jgi:MFS family permease